MGINNEIHFPVTRRNFLIACIIAGTNAQQFAVAIGKSVQAVQNTLHGLKSAPITAELQQFIDVQLQAFCDDNNLCRKDLLPICDVARKRKAA